MNIADETNLETANTTTQNSDSLSILKEFTDAEIEETMNRIAEFYGSGGELLAVGFQNNQSFLDTFGSQYS